MIPAPGMSMGSPPVMQAQWRLIAQQKVCQVQLRGAAASRCHHWRMAVQYGYRPGGLSPWVLHQVGHLRGQPGLQCCCHPLCTCPRSTEACAEYHMALSSVQALRSKAEGHRTYMHRGCSVKHRAHSYLFYKAALCFSLSACCTLVAGKYFGRCHWSGRT